MLKKNALIVLEAPWELREGDQNIVSVLPFFHGLEKLSGDFDLFHSKFYEAKSFGMALDELTKLDYERYYIYVACHGSGRRLHNINLSTVFRLINHKGQSRNVVGVIFGACLIGRNIPAFQVYTEASSIVWKFGYKCIVNWLEGTLLDLKIFQALLKAEDEDFTSAKNLISIFKDALAVYDPQGSIGWELKKEKDDKGVVHYTEIPTKLAKSLTLVVQPKGQGHKANNYSDKLFEPA